jgi:hypothetical protein
VISQKAVRIMMQAHVERFCDEPSQRQPNEISGVAWLLIHAQQFYAPIYREVELLEFQMREMLFILDHGMIDTRKQLYRV